VITIRFFCEGVEVVTVNVQISNPRVTASADIQLDGGPVVQVTVPRDANELGIRSALKAQVQAAADAQALASGQPARLITDDDLVPALAVFARLSATVQPIDI
jgi:hypothetical protein